MARDIGLLVGNGFLIDFLRNNVPNHADWDPQNPVRWKSMPKLADRRDLLNCLPQFKAFHAAVHQGDPGLSDFQIFEALVKRAKPPYPGANGAGGSQFMNQFQAYTAHLLPEVEARHYLVGALSHMYAHLIHRHPMVGWAWMNWLRQHGARIGQVASFNYDVLVEEALSVAGVSCGRVEVREGGDVQIIKPHGSIDFVTQGLPRRTYPMTTGFSSGNNGQVVRFLNLLEPRNDAEIVLPSQKSAIRNNQWVQAGASHWSSMAGTIEHLVIVGLSYWECDRPELDDLVAALSPTVRIYMANPSPSPEWMDVLRGRFGDQAVVEWQSGPQPI